MCVTRFGVGKAYAAGRAQPGAIGVAQRVERQREHDRVAKDGLEVEHITFDDRRLLVLRIRLVGVQLLDRSDDLQYERVEAAPALGRDRHLDLGGHEDPVHDGLEPCVERHRSAGWHADELEPPAFGCLGFDPLWFGVYVIVLAEIGAITPPVGINCFVVKGAAGNLVTLEEIFGALTPFIIASFVMLGIMLVFPQIARYLPSLM